MLRFRKRGLIERRLAHFRRYQSHIRSTVSPVAFSAFCCPWTGMQTSVCGGTESRRASDSRFPPMSPPLLLFVVYGSADSVRADFVSGPHFERRRLLLRCDGEHNLTDYLATGISQPRQDPHSHGESRRFARIPSVSRSARVGCCRAGCVAGTVTFSEVFFTADTCRVKITKNFRRTVAALPNRRP
eukprot:73261-Prymnesium_polylepis.2